MDLTATLDDISDRLDRMGNHRLSFRLDALSNQIEARRDSGDLIRILDQIGEELVSAGSADELVALVDQAAELADGGGEVVASVGSGGVLARSISHIMGKTKGYGVEGCRIEGDQVVVGIQHDSGTTDLNLWFDQPNRLRLRFSFGADKMDRYAVFSDTITPDAVASAVERVLATGKDVG